MVPWVGLQSVSEESPGHTQFLFCFKSNHNIAYAKGITQTNPKAGATTGKDSHIPGTVFMADLGAFYQIHMNRDM